MFKGGGGTGFSMAGRSRDQVQCGAEEEAQGSGRDKVQRGREEERPGSAGDGERVTGFSVGGRSRYRVWCGREGEGQAYVREGEGSVLEGRKGTGFSVGKTVFSVGVRRRDQAQGERSGGRPMFSIGGRRKDRDYNEGRRDSVLCKKEETEQCSVWEEGRGIGIGVKGGGQRVQCGMEEK